MPPIVSIDDTIDSRSGDVELSGYLLLHTTLPIQITYDVDIGSYELVPSLHFTPARIGSPV